MIHLELTQEALDYVLDRQAQYKKEKRTGQLSQSQTIDRIIREHDKIVKEHMALKEEISNLKKLLVEKQKDHET